jgi:penicillin G amidase
MSSGARQSIQSLLVAGAFAAAVVSNAAARDQDGLSSSARLTTTSVAGLQAPGKILVDLWGIPHIYADNEHDLFFLQGFNAARDRLWQIDLWRKRGLGRLAKRPNRPGNSSPRRLNSASCRSVIQ